MNIIGVDDYVKFPKYRPSKTQPYMREYYSELTTSEISQLYEIFELDFKLYGYDRLPGPLEKLIKNTTVSEKTNQENRKDKQFIVCLFVCFPPMQLLQRRSQDFPRSTHTFLNPCPLPDNVSCFYIHPHSARRFLRNFPAFSRNISVSHASLPWKPTFECKKETSVV